MDLKYFHSRLHAIEIRNIRNIQMVENESHAYSRKKREKKSSIFIRSTGKATGNQRIPNCWTWFIFVHA